MAQKVYALSVAINEYAGKVRNLEACINDNERFYHDYLKKRFKNNLYYEKLENEKANRANVIELFEKHLGKAKEDDVVLIRYSGHGAQSLSAKEFKQYFPDGKDEGLVLYDSRTEGKYDLADKEFAVLLANVAKNNPHIAVILDSCHSGSATRDVDEFNQLVPRFTSGRKEPRPLETYLNGHYSDLLAKDTSKDPEVIIPRSKHILLAACDRKETAKEDPTIPHGIFTETLLEILEEDLKKGGNISYRNLFLRCRSEVRKRAQEQSPQFETFEQFNANTGFLGGPAAVSERYPVEYKRKIATDEGKRLIWKLGYGAINGLPTDRSKSAKLALYKEGKSQRSVGTAATTMVGPTESEVLLDFDGEIGTQYWAEITDLPIPPAPVYLAGDKKGKELLQKALEKNKDVLATFTDKAEGTKYSLIAEDEKFLLKERETDNLIQWARGFMENAAKDILDVLKAVLRWERSLALQNQNPKIDPDYVDYTMSITEPGGNIHKFNTEEINLNYEKIDGKWYKIPGKLKVKNNFRQQLHCALFYFSGKYGIYFLGYNEPIDPGQDATVWGENPGDHFKLGKDVIEDVDIFKLIVSTEKIDSFLLEQESIKMGACINCDRAIGSVDDEEEDEEVEKIESDWFTKTIRVKTVRQLDKVSERDTSLANGQIQIKGHPSLKANLSLAAAKTNTRSVSDGPGIYQFLEQNGMDMVSFSAATRDVDDEESANQNILELTDLPEDLDEVNKALEKQPLEIELNTRLKADEYILPLVFDGEHILLAGDAAKDENGNTQISIDNIPDIDDHSRSIGKSLKLYFFKTSPYRPVADSPIQKLGITI